MMTKNWRDTTKFIRSPKEAQPYARIGYFGQIYRERAGLQKAVKIWQPFSPALVTMGLDDRTVPIVEHELIGTQAIENMLIRVRLTMLIILASAVILFSIWLWTFDGVFGRASGVAAALLLSCYVIYRKNFNDRRALKELGQYVCWFSCSWGSALTVVAGFALLIGILQSIIQPQTGGLENLVERYGLYFERFGEGEWWRILIGPYFHADWAHWAINSAMLIVAVAIAYPSSLAVATSVFLLGNVVGPYFSYTARTYTGADGFVGMSAGVFAVYGLMLGATAGRPRDFPKNFGYPIASFVVLNFLTASLITKNASVSAHAAGLFFGFVVGLIGHSRLLSKNL